MIIHQIYIGNDLENILNHFKTEIKSFKSAPGCSYHLWTEPDIINMLTKCYPKEVLLAYNLLVPPAYKSDLARACIVNVFGGWYSDLANTLVSIESLKMAENESYVVFRDFQDKDFLDRIKHKPAISNGFFYSKPKTEGLTRTIDYIVKNVLEKSYGDSPWCVTGPTVFGRAFYELYEKDSLWNDFKENENHRKAYYYNGTCLAIHKDSNKPELFKNLETNYVNLWDFGKVYKT